MMTNFSDLINGFLGKPIWGAEKGHGSFLTFNLGKPRVELDDPKIQKVFSDSEIRFPKNTYESRNVRLRGDFFIWVYCCNWSFTINEKEIAHNESNDDEIKNAVDFIDGQLITKVSLNPENLKVIFKFDLAGQLTLSVNKDYEPETKLIMIENNGNWISITNQNELIIEDDKNNIMEQQKIDHQIFEIKN